MRGSVLRVLLLKDLREAFRKDPFVISSFYFNTYRELENNTPPLGTYDVTANDIQNKVLKKAYAKGNPLTNPPFDSTAPARSSKAQANPNQNEASLALALPPSNPKTKQNAQAFQSSGKRFESNLKTEGVPPPGAYESRLDWDSKSFNVIYNLKA